MRPLLWSLTALLVLTTPALAAAPKPAKAVGPQFFTGRWFEIARTYNANQKDCHAPTYDFAPGSNGAPRFTLTCRKGSPSGPADTLNARIKLPAGPDQSIFRVSALAGLVNQDYVVLDHDEGYSWAMMGTAGGNYVWLVARQPTLAPAQKSALTARLSQLGYDTAKLVFPRF